MNMVTLYTCLIEEQTEDEAFVQVYWARADHIGAAIEKMVAVGRQNGLINPEPRQLDPYNIKNIQGEVDPSLNAQTFWAKGRACFKP